MFLKLRQHAKLLAGKSDYTYYASLSDKNYPLSKLKLGMWRPRELEGVKLH